MDTRKAEEEWSITHAVCCAASRNRTVDFVYTVIDAFLEEREELAADYCENPIDPSSCFQTEKDMLSVFANRPNLDQLFFWNEKGKKKDMVGACFTSDGGIVFSVTTEANGQNEESTLEKLKDLLQTNRGLISYNAYPDFVTIEDFERQIK